MTTVMDRIRCTRPVFSVEFMPPRGSDDEQRLWNAVRDLEGLDPAFISVTYGAGGSSRDLTIRTTARVAQETTLTPMAHLTAVNHSVSELRNVVGWYAAHGIRNILALRGDPPGDPTGEWTPHPNGLNHADELVRLIQELGDFCVGVAAFPYGHPASTDLTSDTAHLIRKFDAGADFGVAQLFFEPEDFLRLRDRVVAAGCDAVLLPGIMPLVSPRIFAKTVELAGALPSLRVASRLGPLADDPKAFRAAGLDLATEIGERLLVEGVPGLHFYTFNRAQATKEVVRRLGLAPVRV